MCNRKIKNAIILAAGMGTRLHPITHESPKCLISVNGIPIIEKQIQILQKIGVSDIAIISGYMADKLNYLSEKYKHVEIQYNDKFELYNNLYSLSLVADKLGDTIILDGDVYIQDASLSVIQKALQDTMSSFFFTINKHSTQQEWIPLTGDNGYIEEIYTTTKPDQSTMIAGISYWTKNDGVTLREKINEYIKADNFKNLFWEDIVLENCSSFKVKTVELSNVYEIDTIDDLKQLNNKYSYDK